jgi:hypothetical protein
MNKSNNEDTSHRVIVRVKYVFMVSGIAVPDNITPFI